MVYCLSIYFFLLTNFINCSQKEDDTIRTTFFGCLNEYINLYGQRAALCENDFAQKKPNSEDVNFFTIQAFMIPDDLRETVSTVFVGCSQKNLVKDIEKCQKTNIKVQKNSTMRDIWVFLIDNDHYIKDNDVIQAKKKFLKETSTVRNCLSKKSQHNDICDFLYSPDTETYKNNFNNRVFQAQRENKFILGIQTVLFLALSITYCALGWHTQFGIKRNFLFFGAEALLVHYIKKDCNTIMIMSKYIN